jgi:hypothetical protein
MRVFPECNAQISAAHYYSRYLFSTRRSIKKLLKNIAIFAVKISFSQRYVLITFLFSNLIKEVLNNFVYTARVSQKIRKLLK